MESSDASPIQLFLLSVSPALTVSVGPHITVVPQILFTRFTRKESKESFNIKEKTESLDTLSNPAISMEDHNRSMCCENGPAMMKPSDLRCYSASYAQTQIGPKNMKKEKSIYKSWSFSDAEFQRKKRIASYKMYCVEGKAKGSLRKGFKWLKDKYSQAIYGCW